MRNTVENRISINGMEYPLMCNNYVLCAIQDKFGTISGFERLLIGKKDTGRTDDDGRKIHEKTERSIAAINFAAVEMVNEGMNCDGERGNLPELDELQIIRGLDDNFFIVSEIIHDEFARCFVTKKP